ncbi:MAG: cell envelope integrity protein TolA, partial [Arenicellales bacterium]|nr:cell envelope integrity protein TolA [Arenicellales bacterium]
DKAKKEKAKKEKAEREKERQLQEQREVEEAHQRDQTQAYSAIGALVGRIGAKVRENWNKPPGTMTGLETVISVKVKRTGEVVSVKVVKSSGNDYFDQSAENAVYKASPLPFPDEPRYYEFIKEFNFKFVPDGD